jgi:hypothetical protein
MCPRRESAPLDFLVADAHNHRCVRSGVLKGKLNRLDEFPSLIRYRANWQGKAWLLNQGRILA